MDITPEQYEQKRQELLAKFNKQFIDNNYTHDPYTIRVVESLITGANPYEIIEHLVTANQELLKEFDKLIRNQS
jgi:phospholipase/lecithinase/hemolysin